MESSCLHWQSPALRKGRHHQRNDNNTIRQAMDADEPLLAKEDHVASTMVALAPTTSSSENEPPTIWRTRSLDDSHRRVSSATNEPDNDSHKIDQNLRHFSTRNEDENGSNEDQQQQLHSSFDASFLESDFNSVFRTSKGRPASSAASPFCNNDATPHSSGRKHLRQPRSGTAFRTGEETEDDELVCPGTVRKLARHNSNESSKSKGTPVRPPTHWKPSRLQATANANVSVWKPPRIGFPLTPTAPGSASTATTHPTTTQQRPLADSSNDASNNLSPNTTPFRFTTFPASLPRVQPREKHNNDTLADSVRKRMTFGLTPSGSFGHPYGSNNHHAAGHNHRHSNPNNQSREEDQGTQNTSISSLSSHGEEDPRMPPVHTRLFPGEEYNYSDDDDEDDNKQQVSNGFAGDVGRTRLNFSKKLSPKSPLKQPADDSPFKDLGDVLEKHSMDMPAEDADDATSPTDLSLPYEQRHVHSFPSTMSTHSPLRNLSGCEDIAHDVASPHFLHRGSQTPEDVQLHFQFDDAQCSPIPGIPEEHELRVRPPFPMKKTASRLPPKPHPASNEANLPPASLKSTSNDTFHHTNRDEKTNEPPGSIGHESASSSSSSKLRRLRPMPDMAAFEMDSSSKTGPHERSMDDGSGVHSAPSPKLRCPPTPVRTPAWAHTSDDQKDATSGEDGQPLFHRSNSLIMTRVLATCSEPSFSSSDTSGTRPTAAKSAGENYNINNATTDHEMDMGPASSKLESGNIQDEATNHPEAPPRIRRSIGEMGTIVSFATDFEILRVLGKGAFADVYKVRSRLDNRLYAVKRNRRHFRGKRDRDMALAEVRSMQRLQQDASTAQSEEHKNLQYLLFFYRAWQEDGHFFCQTELCCRDTCRELMDNLSTEWCVAKTRYRSLLRHLPPPQGVAAGGSLDVSGRLVPNMTVWKVCHDICAGLSHIHSRGLVHNDIKPSNIFLVIREGLGSVCKIGDFGMAGEIGTSEDGQEGDQKYMAPELLTSDVRHASSDIFSLGLTLYELAAGFGFDLPKQGPRWHELRSGSHAPELPSCREASLGHLLQQMISPSPNQRPQASSILKSEKVDEAGRTCDEFLHDYIKDIEDYDRSEEERLLAVAHMGDDQTPRNSLNGSSCRVRVCSPTLVGQFASSARTNIFTPQAHSS